MCVGRPVEANTRPNTAQGRRPLSPAALVVAHALNRTLLLRRYLPTFHDRRAAVDIGAYFDTDALQGCVPGVPKAPPAENPHHPNKS